MAVFNSPAAFAAFLPSLIAKVDHARHAALEEASQLVQDEAKRVLGTYEYGWPQLKPDTIARKATGDSPLLESREMRDSIQRSVGHAEARVGSNEDKAVWHELGTAKVPPRPFLTGAAAHKEKEIQGLLGKHVVGVLIGGKP